MEIDNEIAEIIPVFVENLGKDINLLRAVMSVEDAEETSRTAHKLKSACGSFGFTGLYEIAFSIEKSAHKRDWKAVHKYFKDFNLYFINLDIVFVQKAA